ncbi:MAG: response regulator [Aggregatilineales bacterium]
MDNSNGEPFILVVDDHETNIDLMSRMLRRADFNIIAAFDGQEACDVLAEQTPILILSDIMMPRMDGYQLLEHVRSNAHLASIPFIFVSAKGNPVDMEHGMNLGANAYLSKPFRPQELIDAVKRHAAAFL